MNVPTPNEFAANGGFKPFPPRWERWLSSVRASILSSQPRAGRHVSIDEHPGKGTVINVDNTSALSTTPPVGCACSATVTFHDIVFDCGCLLGDPSTSFILTDSSLDGMTIVEPLQAGLCPPNCTWAFFEWVMPFPIHTQVWAVGGNTTCTGDPSDTIQRTVILYILLIEGIYYAFGYVFSGVGNAVVFIGSSADPSNIPNDAFCSASPTDWQNPVTDCINSGLPLSWVGGSHGGHISVVLNPC